MSALAHATGFFYFQAAGVMNLPAAFCLQDMVRQRLNLA